jgi:hypothetical protein
LSWIEDWCCYRRLLSICSLLLVLVSAVDAQTTIQVEAGLDGTARPGRSVPVRVTATNNGAPISGRLGLMVEDPARGPAAVQTWLPLELPSSANKRLETAMVPLISDRSFMPNQQSITAMLREGKQERARGQARLTVLPLAQRLLAVCAEDAGGLRFMSGVPLGEAGWALPLEQQMRLQGEPTATAHVPADQMPAIWAGLEAADLLVIRDAAWLRLLPAQRRAVRQWVEMHGRLLLCGEDADGFQDEEGRRLLPVVPVGLQPRPALNEFPLPEREPILATGGQVTTVRARLRPGASAVLREGSDPLVVSRPTGFGMVLWLGFDPFRVPPGSLPGRRVFWAFLIRHATGAIISEPAFPSLTDVPPAKDPVANLPRLPVPSRWALGFSGVGYVLLFGPVNIWLLRRLRRTVRAWLLMPALSLLLTGGVLALGTAWGGTHIVFHTLSVLEAMAGSGTAHELNLSGLFSPTGRAFSLEIQDPAPTVRFLSEDGVSLRYSSAAYLRNSDSEATPITPPNIREGGLCRWDPITITLWTLQLFTTERAANLGDGVRLDLNDHLTGRVINGTPQTLRDTYLQYRGWRYGIGSLAPGATSTVSAQSWQRWRKGDEDADSGGRRLGATEEAAKVTSGRASGSSGPWSDETDLLFARAGSLLLGTGGRSEVVLVARIPGPSSSGFGTDQSKIQNPKSEIGDLACGVPLRVPGAPATPMEGTRAGAILLIRQPIPAALPGAARLAADPRP